MGTRSDVTVVGGGVIGLACANAFLDAGRDVLVLERDLPGRGASHGNCGLITPSHALPLTRPGLVRGLPRMLWREDSPLVIRPRLDLEFLGWGLRLIRNCSEAAVLRSLRGRTALLESSRDMFADLVERDGLRCEWETPGLLEVFATEKAMAAAGSAHRLLAEHGVHSEALTKSEVLAREPALRNDLVGGVWYPRDARLRPDRLMAELERVIRAKGARIESGRSVEGFEVSRGRVTAVRTDDGPRSTEHVVLATGVWSPRLGQELGLRLPLQPGKGYSITMSRPASCPAESLLLSEPSVAVTPWPSGYRLGGTMEFAGFDQRLRPSRLENLRAGARRFLREPLGAEVEEEWFGWRPMTPDELPIIDRAPRHANVILATGHGMMGVSMAPATSRLVFELATGAEPFVDPTPYSVRRF